MANKNLFSRAKSGPATDAINEAGGTAYAFGPEHALAQLAATGTLNDTFYTKAEEQLSVVLDLCSKLPSKYVAQTAIFARKAGYMKDMPALLCAYLAAHDVEMLKRVFPAVIDNAKMLRNFVQIVRSGTAGRKSLGSAPKRLVRGWLETRSDEDVFKASVGNDPSLADIIKMVHPTPKNKAREALYGYLIGRDKYQKRYLPKLVKDFESFKKDPDGDPPAVPFEMLTALNLSDKAWAQIAKDAHWHMTRMNLNTFERHNVFKDKKMVRMVADRLRDEKEIRKARVFPYQLLMAYTMYNGEHEIKEALQDAMEIATENVPVINGRVAVFPDASGSMHSPVTGDRGGGTTAVQCVDVAALVASIFLRSNKSAIVIPFKEDVINVRLNPRDSVMTNAQVLRSLGAGGTNCGAPMAKLNTDNEHVDLVVYVSDNQSWVDSTHGANGYASGWGQGSTQTVTEWKKLKRRCPKAKLVCIDLQANGTSQAKDDKDILNIGGFSDKVFDQIANFVSGEMDTAHWVGEIKKIEV